MKAATREKDFMQYVEQRLEHWADWYSKGCSSGLGYHSESMEYVIMTVGFLIKGTGVKPVPTDENAEEIERLVNEMNEYNETMALALRIHYFGKGPVKKRPNQFGISYSKFKIYVDMAKQWISGRLSAF